MEECPGQRDGSTIYYFDGHMYRRNRSTQTSTYYRCSARGCFGRVIQKHRLGTIVAVSPHNHATDQKRHNLRRFLAAMQRRVNLESIPIYDIYRQEASRFPGIEEVMPYHSLQIQMEKRRRLSELNEVNQAYELNQINEFKLSDIDKMAQCIRVDEADEVQSENSTDGIEMMESHVERFLEQRLEHFPDHALENHYDQNSDQNNAAGLPRCEVTMNNQGGDKLHFNGYSYSKKAISANAIRWTCATPTRSDTRCKGAITTDRERPYHNPRSLVEHNHPPEDSEASIMRDIARAKRRFRRRTFPHPFQFYPWMLPLQQMQEQSGGRDDPSSLEATFGMAAAGGVMGHSEAGPSGYMDDDISVKVEPEWVDAGALEPNCELEGQYDDNQDFRHSEDVLGSHQDNQNYQMFSSQQQSRQLPLIPDSQDPVKLHVPGKPNLTITVAPTRQGPSQSNTQMAAPPLHLLTPLIGRKRGRPRGSAFGSYSESDDRVTTILTDTIIASQKLEKMGAAAAAAAAFRSSPVASVAMTQSGFIKPRSRDPEAVRAAEIVNGVQNRSGPRVAEELEKVHLKLRQEVLALEVQNLKAEREKLKAYRRNVAIRREIMALHLQLGKGIPSECASSGRGFESVESYNNYGGTGCDNDLSSMQKEEVTISKKLPDVPISRHHQSGQSPKISIRKSLQTSNRSPNASPLSSNSSAKGATPPPGNVNKPSSENKEPSRSAQLSDCRQTSDKQLSEGRHDSNNKYSTSNPLDLLGNQHPVDGHRSSSKALDDHIGEIRQNEGSGISSGGACLQPLPSGDIVKDDLVPLDSVSSDLSIEMLSEPGSSQWTTQSSAPMTEHEGFDDLQFEGDDSYDNTDSIGEFSGGPLVKEPPEYGDYSDGNAQKRRRVENMWEPDEGPL